MGKNDLLHKTPSHVATDIDVVMGVRFGHRINVVLEILDAEVVLQNLVLSLVILTLQACAILSHVDDGSTIAVRDPLHELPEADSIRTKPRRLCLRTDRLAILVLEEKLEVTGKVIGIGFGGDVLDVVGTVVVPESVSRSTMMVSK